MKKCEIDSNNIMTMQEENLHAGGKWETMNFLGVVSRPEYASGVPIYN